MVYKRCRILQRLHLSWYGIRHWSCDSLHVPMRHHTLSKGGFSIVGRAAVFQTLFVMLHPLKSSLHTHAQQHHLMYQLLRATLLGLFRACAHPSITGQLRAVQLHLTSFAELSVFMSYQLLLPLRLPLMKLLPAVTKRHSTALV
jgi:hypothetical protein